MNNHFGFCVPNALMHFMFHCGKIERQLSRLLWRSLPLPRTKFSRSGHRVPDHWGCVRASQMQLPAGHKNDFFAMS